ncbi:MAG TPA: hypothetical protein VFK50_01150 [Sphingomicrobium sp.]|nr:hypothetical protein [Sphingomicrobium sp.]
MLKKASPDVSRRTDLALRHPPRPRFALNIGITGHRATVLPRGTADLIRPILDEVFRELRAAAEEIHDQETEIFSSQEPLLRLHTPLASGSDQLAAQSARASNFFIRALLPFAPEEYRKDFEGPERDDYDLQLAMADALFSLPGDREEQDEAYVNVGKAVIAAADILVAIWDGREGNGRGGTAHVVDLALGESVPVIHIEIDRAHGLVERPRLLTGGDAIEPIAKPLKSSSDYVTLLRDTLSPHTSLEREQIAEFFTERERRINWRFEYPMLLAVLGIKRFTASAWRQSSVEQDISWEWDKVAGMGPGGTWRPLALAYGWSNFLAIRYAQMFRSGHVTNYFLSALAVILALFGLLAPGAKIFLVVAELATIGLLFLNTSAGTGGEWHRRWLQYRHLAESLRPLVYLKRSGMISTPFRTDFVQGTSHREAGADWTRWYAAAIWREMESPTGITTHEEVRALAKDVMEEQIVPQAKYHDVNSHRMEKLDHRLHEIGNFLMGGVIAACVLFLAGYVPFAHYVKALTAPFIFLTAGLPAVGAAVFGMRGHGEHLLAASRSANTALALQRNAARLKHVFRADLLAAELEKTAAIMLADLNEWTVSYRERSLEIPA